MRKNLFAVGGGVLLILLSYIVTLLLVSPAFTQISSPVKSLENNGVQGTLILTFATVAMIVIPYLMAGLLIGFLKIYDMKLVVTTGLLATTGERIAILGAAASVLSGFRRVTATGEIYYVEGSADLVASISSEVLPYFTWPYIILGVPISIVTLYVVTKVVQWLRNRAQAQGFHNSQHLHS